MSYGRAVQYGKFGYPDAMVLKMGTQKGESGGPVFNEQGQLVGMVVSTLTDANGNLINLRARDTGFRPGALPVQQHELRRRVADHLPGRRQATAATSEIDGAGSVLLRLTLQLIVS